MGHRGAEAEWSLKPKQRFAAGFAQSRADHIVEIVRPIAAFTVESRSWQRVPDGNIESSQAFVARAVVPERITYDYLGNSVADVVVFPLTGQAVDEQETIGGLFWLFDAATGDLSSAMMSGQEPLAHWQWVLAPVNLFGDVLPRLAPLIPRAKLAGFDPRALEGATLVAGQEGKPLDSSFTILELLAAFDDTVGQRVPLDENSPAIEPERHTHVTFRLRPEQAGLVLVADLQVAMLSTFLDGTSIRDVATFATYEADEAEIRQVVTARYLVEPRLTATWRWDVSLGSRSTA